tara:strand:+ start:4338 stop:6929 length:2592 start_codon:yes stop_codon:yes gene_type:complete
MQNISDDDDGVPDINDEEMSSGDDESSMEPDAKRHHHGAPPPNVSSSASLPSDANDVAFTPEQQENNRRFEEIERLAPNSCMWMNFKQTFAEFGHLLFDRSSPFAPHNLFGHQLDALERIVKHTTEPLSVEELEKTKPSAEEQEAIEKVLAKQKVGCERACEASTVRMASVCNTLTRKTDNLNFRVRLPCGAGKTALGIWVCLLIGKNALFLTDTVENSVQVLKALLLHTNIASIYQVKIVRQETETKDKLRTFCEEAKVDIDRIYTDKICSDENTYFKRHILEDGGAYGIVIMDSHTFKEQQKAGEKAQVLRRTLFQGPIDTLIVDEADSTLTETMRDSLLHGVVGEPVPLQDSHDCDSILRTFRLNHKHGMFMSATWYRGEDNPGAQYLFTIPQIVSEKAITMEERGYISNSSMNIVVCHPSAIDTTVTAAFKLGATKRKSKVGEQTTFSNAWLKDLTPSKMRAIETIVKFHTRFGHKILIYAHHIIEINILESMFPSCVRLTGEETKSRMESLQKMAEKTNAYGEKQSNVYVASKICSNGLDLPDLHVVINAVNFGESPREERQRGGRSSRRFPGKEKCWYYSMMGIDEEPWVAPLLADPMNEFKKVQRYEILRMDGYDASRMNVWKDADLRSQMMGYLVEEETKHPNLHDAAKKLAYESEFAVKTHVAAYKRLQLKNDSFILHSRPSAQKTRAVENERRAKDELAQQRKRDAEKQRHAKKMEKLLSGKSKMKPVTQARKPTSAASGSASSSKVETDGRPSDFSKVAEDVSRIIGMPYVSDSKTWQDALAVQETGMKLWAAFDKDRMDYFTTRLQAADTQLSDDDDDDDEEDAEAEQCKRRQKMYKLHMQCPFLSPPVRP